MDINEYVAYSLVSQIIAGMSVNSFICFSFHCIFQ